MSTQEISTEWSRRRLLAMLAGVVAFGLVILGGLAYAVVVAFSPDRTSADSRSPDHQHWSAGPDGVRGDQYRDALAARPMLSANEDDMTPAAPALDEPDRMLIGPSTAAGPAEVPTGFAQAPEGAVAQLAAIEIAALTPMSVQYARDVHNAWAMEGVSFEQWEIAQSIQSFHASAGTVDGDGSVSVTATPVGAQIKGTDGPDWVLACVQLDVTAAVVEQTRFGFGHCERMQWTDGRWMIAAGAPPAQAPSTWPGSQRSLDAGWHLWVEADDHDE